MDWSDINMCIKCNEGGSLLICSENSCPIAVHEECLGCPARFDDAGKFYCPYCLYKQAVAELRQAREFSVLTQKAFSIFMGKETTGCETHMPERRGAESERFNQLKVGPGNANLASCQDGKTNQRNAAILRKSIQDEKEHKFSHAEEENIQEKAEASGACEDCNINSPRGKKIQLRETKISAVSRGQEHPCKTHEKHKITRAGKEKIQEEQCEPSSASSEDNPSLKVHGERRIRSTEVKQTKEDVNESSSDCSCRKCSLTVHGRNKRKFERRDSIYSDSEAVSEKNHGKQNNNKRQKSPAVILLRRSSRRLCTSQSNNEEFNEDVDASSRLKESEQPSVKLANKVDASSRLKEFEETPSKLKNEKIGASNMHKQSEKPSVRVSIYDARRKRLLWTEEEEKKLEEGVEKYMDPEKKNIPWRKILEFGRNTFEETRNPTDLKDKWRKMVANDQKE